MEIQQQQELKLAKDQRHQPYNLSEDVKETYRRQNDAFWRKQWDEILYPDWT